MKRIPESSRPVTPDSLTGMVFAAEGVTGAITLINGPMGCKFYHSTTSGHLIVHPPLSQTVRYRFHDNLFFGQARVPCTWLDGNDYIQGTSEQVRSALDYLRRNLSFDFLVIVDSPGASLIGDDLVSLCAEELPGVKCVILESPGYSQTFDDGYSRAGLEILKQGFAEEFRSAASGRRPSSRPRVNILGLTIWQRYYEGDKKELIRLFDLIGADVNTTFLAGSSPDDILSMTAADLNIVFDRDRGLAQAKWLKETTGIPYYVFETWPLGFKAVEKGFKEIAALLGTDAGPLTEDSERARALAYNKILAIHEASGLPDGALFYVVGDPAQVRAYSTFLSDYLGMKPAPAEEAELVFGDANTIASLMTRRSAFCGIEISYPGMGYTDLIPKTHLGIQGALFLIEQVLNGLMSRL